MLQVGVVQPQLIVPTHSEGIGQGAVQPAAYACLYCPAAVKQASTASHRIKTPLLDIVAATKCSTALDPVC